MDMTTPCAYAIITYLVATTIFQTYVVIEYWWILLLSYWHCALSFPTYCFPMFFHRWLYLRTNFYISFILSLTFFWNQYRPHLQQIDTSLEEIGLPPRGTGGSAEAELSSGGGGPGGDHSGIAYPRRISTSTGEKDGGMADGAAVQGKRDRTGCEGMAICPLPEIWTIPPRPPPRYCYFCNTTFSICHTLDCKRFGLVTERHNKIRDGVADLARKAFTPSYVREYPLIFAGCAAKRPKKNTSRTKWTTAPDDTPPKKTEGWPPDPWPLVDWD